MVYKTEPNCYFITESLWNDGHLPRSVKIEDREKDRDRERGMMGLKIETVKTEKGIDLKTGKGIDLTKVLPLAIKMAGVIRCLYFQARISTCQNLLMNLTYLIVSAAVPVTVCCQRMYAIFFFFSFTLSGD
jgi:hypothetical protein